ncbi:MAG TPA: hypothetical protein PKD12_03705 [Nitrospira sp.]|nr:hypothetical protein [Nitrospira sp.]
MNSAQAMRVKGNIHLGSILALVGTSLVLTSCQDLGWGKAHIPPTTRTGVIREVIIRDTVSPSVLTAHPGDEIRWINKRQGGAKIVFLDPVEAQLSCQDGFGVWRGANPNQFAADIGPNNSASVCFKAALKAKYVIEADSTLLRPEKITQGSISVETAQAATSGILRSRDPTPNIR